MLFPLSQQGSDNQFLLSVMDWKSKEIALNTFPENYIGCI